MPYYPYIYDNQPGYQQIPSNQTQQIIPAMPSQPRFQSQPNQSFSYPTQTAGIIYVQGLAGAQAYYVGAGQSALLMDAKEPIIYFKQTDMTGRPMPILVGDVTFREEGANEKSE